MYCYWTHKDQALEFQCIEVNTDLERKKAGRVH